MPILFQPPKAHLQRRGGTGTTRERDRPDVAVGKDGRHVLDVLRLAGEVEVEPSTGDHRAVHDAPPALAEHGCDPLGASWCDRVRLQVEPAEASLHNLTRHLFGDRWRAEADHDVAPRNELGERTEIAEPGGAGALRCRFAAALARPQHLAVRCDTDLGAHLAWKEEADS
jgi:hypothetical protein